MGEGDVGEAWWYRQIRQKPEISYSAFILRLNRSL
jgi:hypothetical protein